MSTAARLHFVKVPDPGRTVSTGTSKTSKSHAARETHAKKRRQRMKEYQDRVGGGESESGRFQSPGVDDVTIARLEPGGTGKPDGRVPDWDIGTSHLLDHLSSSYTDPFAALGRHMTGMEYFLLHHYMKAIAPYLAFYCPRLEFRDAFLPDWLKLLGTDIGLIYGILVTASRHLQLYHWLDQYMQDACQTASHYKVLCQQELRRGMQAEAGSRAFSIATVAKAFVLGFDEMAFGDIQVGNNHLEAICKMVGQSGGAESLSENSFIHHIYLRLTEGKLIEEYMRDGFVVKVV